ncbi:Site-specific recombinase [Granulibacter bethesdensis CGDNIH4]|nr:Site-specific recombinase [Granulibacter bethesdensis CGDNIH4]
MAKGGTMLNCIMLVETVIPSLSHATKDGQNTLRTVICVMSWPEPVIPPKADGQGVWA